MLFEHCGTLLTDYFRFVMDPCHGSPTDAYLATGFLPGKIDHGCQLLIDLWCVNIYHSIFSCNDVIHAPKVCNLMETYLRTHARSAHGDGLRDHLDRRDFPYSRAVPAGSTFREAWCPRGLMIPVP
jgi:hypothetical protein